MQIEIVPMQIHHISELVNNIREGDIEECKALNLTPMKMLIEAYKKSLVKKATLLNGRVAALWGVSGSYLAPAGYVWLLTSKEVDKAPVHLAAAYRREVRKLLEIFPRLENYCDFAYKRSLRMLELCGFTVGEPEPFGPNGALFCKFFLEAAHDN